MSPQSHEQLPAPDEPIESGPHEVPTGQPIEQVHEAEKNRAMEQAAPAPAPSVAVPDPAQTMPQPPPQPDPAAQHTTLPQGWMPQIADDTDLIEKEWVDKAKEIVAQTAHDPYLQNKEINKVRREYLKKRYNKDLKQSE